MPKVELGTIEFSVEIKDGRATPRMDIIQDNLRELEGQVPDGNYAWVCTLDLDKALTIGQLMQRGFILCPKCHARRTVDKEFNVKSCESCGDAPEYWNLMVSTN